MPTLETTDKIALDHVTGRHRPNGPAVEFLDEKMPVESAENA